MNRETIQEQLIILFCHIDTPAREVYSKRNFYVQENLSRNTSQGKLLTENLSRKKLVAYIGLHDWKVFSDKSWLHVSGWYETLPVYDVLKRHSWSLVSVPLMPAKFDSTFRLREWQKSGFIYLYTHFRSSINHIFC